MCKYVCLCLLPRQTPHLPQAFPPGFVYFYLQCYISRSFCINDVLLLDLPESPPSPKAPDPPIVTVFMSQCAKSTPGLELPEALLTTLGGHKAIFMQPDLSILPSSLRPRIVNDRVLEETPPCHWMLCARRRRSRSSAGGTCKRPSSQTRGSSKVERSFQIHHFPRSRTKD
jgi:hypothetical protein